MDPLWKNFLDPRMSLVKFICLIAETYIDI